jgi:hypothetical protein
VIAYLLTGIPATGNDGNTADLEELHFGGPLLLWALVVDGGRSLRRGLKSLFSKSGPEIKLCGANFPHQAKVSKLMTNNVTCIFMKSGSGIWGWLG